MSRLLYALHASRVVVVAVALWATPAAPAQADPIEEAGDAFQIILPLGALAATAILDRDLRGPLQFGASFTASSVTTAILKAAIDKPRPDNPHRLDSFPSGHTSAAFVGAAFVHRRYGFVYAIPSYALAGFVGYSRVHAGRHDAIDVLAGAAIGIGSAFIFARRIEGPVFIPGIGRESASLRVMTRF